MNENVHEKLKFNSYYAFPKTIGNILEQKTK